MSRRQRSPRQTPASLCRCEFRRSHYDENGRQEHDYDGNAEQRAAGRRLRYHRPEMTSPSGLAKFAGRSFGWGRGHAFCRVFPWSHVAAAGLPLFGCNKVFHRAPQRKNDRGLESRQVDCCLRSPQLPQHPFTPPKNFNCRRKSRPRSAPRARATCAACASAPIRACRRSRRASRTSSRSSADAARWSWPPQASATDRIAITQTNARIHRLRASIFHPHSRAPARRNRECRAAPRQRLSAGPSGHLPGSKKLSSVRSPLIANSP